MNMKLRKAYRTSYGGSSSVGGAEVNLISNPVSVEVLEDELENYNFSSPKTREQFEYFLQERRIQARKRQQQVFEMSALLPPASHQNPHSRSSSNNSSRHH